MAQRKRFIFIAGPCVIESPALTFSIARSLQKITGDFDVDFYFKASFDKANRTSLSSYRGPGIADGLAVLARVKERLGVKVLSDVHSIEQIEQARTILDCIQIPAFLCRQTDLLVAAARSGKFVNVKKGQFVSPFDMKYAVDKIEKSGNRKIMLTERGSTFGYNNLVVDFRSFQIMREFGHPVIFDATHSVQLPSAGSGCSGGDRRFVVPLARAAVAFGCDGMFIEVHPQPEKALCDGPNSVPLSEVRALLKQVFSIKKVLRN